MAGEICPKMEFNPSPPIIFRGRLSETVSSAAVGHLIKQNISVQFHYPGFQTYANSI